MVGDLQHIDWLQPAGFYEQSLRLAFEIARE